MVPKLIYELQPYLYLGFGAASVISTDNAFAQVAGGTLYCLGALVWIMRSNYRRKDQRRMPRDRVVLLPESLYEFVPFLYVAAAILLLSITVTLPSVVFALLLLVQGGHMLYQRQRYRSYQWHGLRYH